MTTPEPLNDPPAAEPTLDGVLDQLDDADGLVLRARESLEETLGALKLTPRRSGRWHPRSPSSAS